MPHSHRAQQALPWGAGGNPSVNGAHLVHSSTPRHSLGIPSNIPWLSWELREQGGTEGSPPAPPQLGAKVQQCLVDHHKHKKFKNQQLLPCWGWQLRGQDWLCQREGQQEALEWELEGLNAQCSTSTSTLLLVPFAAASPSPSLPVPLSALLGGCHSLSLGWGCSPGTFQPP